MATTSPLRRAAQYLRMSTEQQQYSTENQKDAICAYAALRGIEIVATYEDAGKSGLTLAKRPSLRKLIADVVAEKVEFDSILVYDVSRWGRFQDADESAHLEYICRMAGVHVEYCAEPFSNDGTPFSNICKVVKRALAAEYSRELSTKVYAGKRRLIQLGFRQGGSAGFGFRRCLIDELGKRKGLLSRGIRKSIMTDRVILVPGPPKEIAIVRRIYRDYAERHIGTQNIADTLNQEGVRSESGRPWSKAVVKNVLTSEKYIGNSVWGRSSIKIGERPHRNTPDQWTRYENAYEGIVSRSLFEKAQTLRAKRSRKWSDDEIVSLLKSIYAQHGAITTELIREQGGIRADAIRDRFGGLYCAYKRIGFCPRRNLDFVALDCASAQLRTSTAIKTIEIIRKCGGTLWRVRDGCLYVINGEIRTSLAVSKERYKRSKKPLWRIKIGGSQDDLTLAAQMVGSNSQACAYYFFPSFEIGNGIFLSKENPVLLEAFRFANLDVLTRICARIDLSAGLGIAQPVPSCTIEHGCQRLGTFLPPSMKKKRFRTPSEK